MICRLLRLDPSGLHRSEGKWSDGMIIVPWEHGMTLIWIAMCADSLTPSYRGLATNCAVAKYHLVWIIAIEALKVFGPNLMEDRGHRIYQRTGEVKYLA